MFHTAGYRIINDRLNILDVVPKTPPPRVAKKRSVQNFNNKLQ